MTSERTSIRHVPTAANAHAPRARGAYQAPLVSRVRALQTTVGNQAVARIAGTPAAAAPTGASRRAPGTRVLARETGLRTATNVTSFADTAEAYWYDPANNNKPLQDYAEHLMTKVNGMLKALGSVECRHSYNTSGGDSGSFSRTTWNIEINPNKFSDRTGVTEVGQLTLDEAKEVADTIFHESRHSEQYFRIARLQAGRVGPKVTDENAAKQISDDMSIPLDVAKAGVKVPLKPGTDDAELISEASDWETITVGRHGEYKGNVNTWSAESREAEIKDVTQANVDTKKAELDTAVAKWKKDKDYVKFAKSHLAKTKKIKAPSTMDQRVVTNLTAVLAKFDALDAATKKASKGWKKLGASAKVSTLNDLEDERLALRRALYAAYRDHIHEEDAWAIGGAVQTAFKSKYEADEQAKAKAEAKAKKKAEAKAKKKAEAKAKKKAEAKARKRAEAKAKKKAAKTATTSATDKDNPPSVTVDSSPPPQPDLSPPPQPDPSPPTEPVLVSVTTTLDEEADDLEDGA